MAAFERELTMQDYQNGDTFTRDLFAWLHQVNADPDLPAAATKIALAISYHINRGNGEAWPSTITLAERASVNKSTASRMVRLLETSGHLSVENGCQGRGHSHRYRTIIKGAQEQISEEEKVRLRNGKGAYAQRKGAPAQRKGAPTQKNYLNNQLKNYLTEPSDSPAAPAEPASLSESDIRPKADLFEQQGREAKEGSKQASKQDPPPGPRAAPPENATAVPSPDTAAGCAVPGQRKSKAKPPADDGAFELFWNAYPRHVAKGGARKAYAAALKKASAADILAGAQRYATDRASQDPKYTRYPTTWLNQECWTDEPAPARVIDQDGRPDTPHRANGHRLSYADQKIARGQALCDQMRRARND
jgi:hypothetical protein